MKSWPPTACFYLNLFRREFKMKLTYVLRRAKKIAKKEWRAVTPEYMAA